MEVGAARAAVGVAAALAAEEVLVAALVVEEISAAAAQAEAGSGQVSLFFSGPPLRSLRLCGDSWMRIYYRDAENAEVAQRRNSNLVRPGSC